MSFVAKHEASGAVLLDRAQVAELLTRYPGVSDREAGQILTFLRRGRHLEVGLLTSNDGLRPKLDAFMKDHKAHFQIKWGEGAAAIAGVIALLTIFWLIWEAFA